MAATRFSKVASADSVIMRVGIGGLRNNRVTNLGTRGAHGVGRTGMNKEEGGATNFRRLT